MNEYLKKHVQINRRGARLHHKLVLGFSAVVLLLWLAGYFAIDLSRQALEKADIKNATLFINGMMDEIDRNIQSKIEIFRAYSSDELLRETISGSNRDFERMDDVHAFINEKDTEWKAAPKEKITPFMQDLLNRKLSKELQEKISFFENDYGFRLFGEIFVTNRYGANIALTGKTSDYRQDDEDWWQIAERQGLYISDVEYVESSDIYSLDIGIRITDKSDNFIGVMKVVLNIEDIINTIKNKKRIEMFEDHGYMDVRLITRGGKLIYSSIEDEMFFDYVGYLLPETERILNKTDHGSPHGRTGSFVNKNSDSGDILFIYTHSTGYRDYIGKGWILLVGHRVDEIFAPVSRLQNRMLLISLAAAVIAALTGLLFSTNITKKIRKLRDAALKIGKGSMDVTLDIRSNDEIGELAKAFRAMSEYLKKTATAKDEMHKEILESRELLRSVVETAKDAIVSIDFNGNVSFWNRSAEFMFGYSSDDIIGKPVTLIIPERFRESHKKGVTGFHSIGTADVTGKTVELAGLSKEKIEFPIELSLSMWNMAHRKYFTAIIRDVSARKKAEEDLKHSQSTILQQEKMASIGQLAAGVAHEINNPMGYITSNLGTLEDYSITLAEFIRELTDAVGMTHDKEQAARLNEKRRQLDIDYILDDIESLIKESLGGAERVKKIVQNLKSFSRMDQAEIREADINDCIESTLNIAWNEIKYRATVQKEYGDIPSTRCNPQELNQVFLNVLVNAAQAIEKQGMIKIRTWNGDDFINISISDTGTGIPEDKISRIFDPFFTTKEVGKGTGLGLSICYDIVKKHNGDISVNSTVGKGTEFHIKIPIAEEQ